MMYLVLGGRRSGKSAHAEGIALSFSSSPIYLATSRIWDEEHKERIELHKKNRAPNWITVEEEVRIDSVPGLSNRTVLLEDLSLWLTNIYMDCHEDGNCALSRSTEILENFLLLPENLILVSSEVGLGIHPETRAGREFADLLGVLNQHLAKQANVVDLVVAGIPISLKK